MFFFFLTVGVCAPSRRSASVINRFHPMLGWRTMLHILACRTTEYIAISVPDRKTLWSRTEDDLLVKIVAKCSTSDILFRDWSEVALELPGHLPQQCKECYRLSDTVTELTFVFLCVAFRDSHSFLTILSRSHKRCRLGGFFTTYSL